MLFKIARKTVGCLFSLLFMVILLAVGVGWATLYFLPTVIEDKIEDRTGFKADLENLEVHLFSGVVNLTDGKIENPETFPAPEFLSVNQIRIDLDPKSIFKDRLLVEDLLIDLDEFGYITRENKENNAALFIGRLRGAEVPEGPSEEEPESGKPPEREFLIRHFTLRLKAVKYADYSGRKPRNRIYETEINLELENVTDLKAVAMPLTRELSKLGLAVVVNSFMQSLIEFGTYSDLANEILKVPVKTMGGGAQALKNGVEETGKAIKNVFDSLKNN